MITVRGTGGAVMSFSGDPFPPGIARQIENGDLVVISADGEIPDDGTPDFTDDQPPGAPPLPRRADNRAVWAQFAISQGMDRDEAAAMTKTQLVDEFTRLRAVS